MGLYAFVEKPYKLGKLQWANADGKEVRPSNILYRKFKDFVFEKVKYTTEKEMADQVGISVEELRERASRLNKDTDSTKIEFPIVSKHYYIASEEISFMGSLRLKDEWYENIYYSNWVTAESLLVIMNNLFTSEEDKNYFKSNIIDRFVEGEMFVSFH